jgi:hypothetical protein
MLWLLFPLLLAFIVIVWVLQPLQAAVGYTITIFWIMFLIYTVFYRKDDISRELNKIGGE